MGLIHGIDNLHLGVTALGSNVSGDPRSATPRSFAAFTPEEMEAVPSPDLRPLAREAWDVNPVRVRYDAEPPTADEVNRRLRTDVSTTLVDEMLTKVDRMTMAAGLEARVPFLDRALLELAFQLPGAYKTSGGLAKVLVRRALAGTLPRTARRPKHGFNVPVGEWLRGPLRGFLRDGLAPEAGFSLFAAAAVDRLTRGHVSTRGNHSRKLLTLLALRLWLSSWTR